MKNISLGISIVEIKFIPGKISVGETFWGVLEFGINKISENKCAVRMVSLADC